MAAVWHTGGVAITPKQLAELERRVSGKRRVAEPVLAATPAARMPARASNQVILGVDPSLRGTGYGVVRMSQPHPVALAHGTITCPSDWPHSRCLLQIMQRLRDIIQQHHPTVCAVEGLFFAQNLKTAIVMGEARGAGMAVMAEAGLEIYELATRKVKQAMVGHGGAQKLAVAKMVQRLLRLEALPAPDAADALALALTYAQETGRFSLNTPKQI
ncbi:MAG: crossover junction endodeoxyribonuclease RuvC [Verrucomicrobiota bacterium]